MLKKLRSIKKYMYLNRLKKRGLKVGKNFNIEKGAKIDAGFPWLVSIGDNVTIAPYVYILAHDGSTKNILGYSKVGRVNIGNNVFIGAKTTILPNVKIGNNVIIGANSLITTNIEDNYVVGGNPARVIMSYDEFKKKNEIKMMNGLVYDKSYTIKGKIDEQKKEEMKEELSGKNGYII